MSTLLRCSAISKSFPGVRALSGVDFELREGEVHAVVGENGAGKSTLMHILAGVHQPDSGTIELQGQPVTIPDERHAQRMGIGIVYQERSLFDLLTVAENIFAGTQPVTRLGTIDRSRLHDDARKLLRRIDLDVDPATPLGRLPAARQQMVEIAKALSFNSRLFILDEPTSVLTAAESETLFRVVRQLRDQGVGIIYISHRLEEVFRLADRVTVLKDGRLQGTLQVSNTSPDELVSLMVGRDLSRASAHAEITREGLPALEVIALAGRKTSAASFSVWPGEILGFGGLAGAGRTELARLIFGADPISSGEIRVQGRKVDIHSPRDAMSAGIGYLPEDRKELGLFLEMTIAENIAAARLDSFGGWRLQDRRMEDVALGYLKRLKIAAPSVQTRAGKLSGGNQQKVLLARWLVRDPSVLIVDEPTRGIDVNAKAEIYALLRSLAREGKAIIVISSDLPELLGLADRILVMRRGVIAGELAGRDASEEAVMRLAAMPVEETLSQ
jgi:ABC-type sugar transport system ATPase subunit